MVLAIPVLDATSRAQHGLFTRAQALSAGLSPRQISYRVNIGAWQEVHRHVYRSRAIASTWHSEVLAAVLASGGVASHKVAIALWDLDVYHTPPVEISVPNQKWFRCGDVISHRSTQWGLRDQVTIDGIPTTGVERSILDVANVTSPEYLERIAEAAIRQRKTDWMALANCLRKHSKQGRNGCLSLRRLLQFRLETKTVPLSDFSRLIEQLLVSHGIPAPVIEYRILDSDGAHVLQTDLAWPTKKKAIELDGLRWHFGREDVERDRRKRNRAKAEGWSILEVLWSMYIDEPADLVRTVQRFLRA